MAKKQSVIHSTIGPRQVGAMYFNEKDAEQYGALSQIGIHLTPRIIGQMMDGIGMDASNDVGLSPVGLSGLTSPTIVTPVQFLQNWLPGFVKVITAARKIDELIGIQTIGAPEDEQVVQGVLEPIGVARAYSDYSNIPLASWNTQYVARSVVRFEQGLSVGWLEDARSSRIRVATAAEKRAHAAIALDIQRNRVGFYGYNDGSGQTYGFLNDPNLPAYVAATTGASTHTTWSTKTFTEITGDFRLWLASLQVNSMDTIDVQKTPITCAVAMSVYQYLTITNLQGTQTVRGWLKENYPNVRVVSAPELDGANGGANVAYVYAETIEDGSSDGGAVWAQVVPAKFITLGVEKRAKSYVEDYVNATAGVMCKRPYAVYRSTGI